LSITPFFWKELQVWQLTLNPNYAKFVENYHFSKSDCLCLRHNPLVCKGCLDPIVESGPFTQDETGCYHAGCKVCFACQKPLVGPYVLQDDLPCHEECVRYHYSSFSSHSNTTVSSYNDNPQIAIPWSWEDLVDNNPAVADTEIEELDLVIAISLSMQEIKPNHFNKNTCSICTYINPPYKKACEMCNTVL
jgi:hypothetical protein